MKDFRPAGTAYRRIQFEAMRYLFYEKVGPEIRSIVPSPDDDLPTGTIIYLALSYVLLDHKSKVILGRNLSNISETHWK